MKYIKLYYLLENLSVSELKKLHKVVHSPVFNSNPSVIKLFIQLKKEYPNFDASSKGRQKLYAKLFPDEAYNDAKLRRLFTFLSRVIEQFLIYDELENESFLKNKLLASIYNKRQFSNLFHKKNNQLLSTLEESKIQDEFYYYEKIQLLDAKYFHPDYPKYNVSSTTLEDLMNSLDTHFVLSKIRLAIALKNRTKIIQSDYDIYFIKYIEKLQNKGLLKDNELFQLYYYSYQLLLERQGINFSKYKDWFNKYQPDLKKEDQLVLYFNGLNYLVRQLNRGQEESSPILLKWYQFGLEKELIFINEQILPSTFSNIVFASCREKEFDWASTFIQSYQEYLPKSIREEELQYNWATFYFFRKDFKEVIDRITNYSFSTQYILKTRNILVRTYFELFLLDEEVYILLENTLKSYANFLYRNDSYTEASKKPHLNFIKILKSLALKIHSRVSKKQIISWFDEQLIKREVIISRKWLEAKIKNI